MSSILPFILFTTLSRATPLYPFTLAFLLCFVTKLRVIGASFSLPLSWRRLWKSYVWWAEDLGFLLPGSVLCSWHYSGRNAKMSNSVCTSLISLFLSCTCASSRWRTWVSIPVGCKLINIWPQLLWLKVLRQQEDLHHDLGHSSTMKEKLICNTGHNVNCFSCLPFLSHLSVTQWFTHISSSLHASIFCLSTHSILLNPDCVEGTDGSPRFWAVHWGYHSLFNFDVMIFLQNYWKNTARV